MTAVSTMTTTRVGTPRGAGSAGANWPGLLGYAPAVRGPEARRARAAAAGLLDGTATVVAPAAAGSATELAAPTEVASATSQADSAQVAARAAITARGPGAGERRCSGQSRARRGAGGLKTGASARTQERLQTTA